MHLDAIVIGGSFAGLSAATYIARARRNVRVIDAGSPRNRFAAHSHGFLTQDGSEPEAILQAARKQVLTYPTVDFVDGRVVSAEARGDGFAIKLDDGEEVQALRLVLAYGISDDLPDLRGLAERWGRSVIHCPYCHGFEFGGKQLGVLYSSPMSAHQAHLVTDWGPTTLYLNGAELDPRMSAELTGHGVHIEPSPIAALHGKGTELSAIEMADGRVNKIDALFVAPRMRANSDLAEQLGCAMDDLPHGRIIRTDGWKATSVPGVFAAGDIARGAHSVTWASADGVSAGVALHRSLLF
ncbi:MAG TPA: NAD(P)/FAD-dependent oxidoreductase [Tianweitania sediminis]|jgi:thioredoxin reductase|nr:NAD(P)/FAD-dependent oxidoreductase [Tianweitania sediminis]